MLHAIALLTTSLGAWNCTTLLAFGLLVLDVLPTIAAILLYIESVRVILFVLHRCVIAAFAGATGQRDNDSVVFLSHRLTPANITIHAKGACTNGFG